jgi:uncharacterized RDD family membrane protein YckC
MSNIDTRADMLRAANDSVRSIITPEGVPIRVELAQRGERLGAALLDLLFVLLTVSLLALALALVNWAIGTSLGGFFLILFMLGNFLLMNFWFTVFELRWNGQTPGKRIMKIRVIDARGGPLSGRAVIVRNIMRDLELFLPIGFLVGNPTNSMEAWQLLFIWLWLGALLALPFINRDRMRGGDLVAGTWVVTAPRQDLQMDIAASAVASQTAHHFNREQLAAYGIYELQTLEVVLRENRPEVLAEVAARIAAKISFTDRIDTDSQFLQDFYGALRSHLEGKVLLGKRKADKFDQG